MLAGPHSIKLTSFLSRILCKLSWTWFIENQKAQKSWSMSSKPKYTNTAFSNSEFSKASLNSQGFCTVGRTLNLGNLLNLYKLLKSQPLEGPSSIVCITLPSILITKKYTSSAANILTHRIDIFSLENNVAHIYENLFVLRKQHMLL